MLNAGVCWRWIVAGDGWSNGVLKAVDGLEKLLMAVKDGGWAAMGREEFDSVGDAGAMGAGNVDLETAVVMHGWPNVPCVDAVRGPSVALVGFGVGNAANAWWCQGCSVVVKSTPKCLVGADGGVQSGGPEQV